MRFTLAVDRLSGHSGLYPGASAGLAANRPALVARSCLGVFANIALPIFYTRRFYPLAMHSGSSPEETLADVARRYDISLPTEQFDRLEQYCRLLWEWNSKLNLTRHTDYRKFVARDLIDSLAFAEHLEQGEHVLDVGSGGGVPGVVLAILRPDLRIELCDSVGKKARALKDIVDRLGLNAPVHHARAENILERRGFDTLTIRAIGRLRAVLEWFKPYWGSFKRMLIVKGPGWVEERGEARHYGLMRDLALRKLKEYPMPGTESNSVLLQICPKAAIQPGKKSLRR
jgi:16S rRNA (guanine527-N7)-methyltransferase